MAAAMAYWLERPPGEREVVSSIRIMRIAPRLACQSQDNGLVKYWLKVVQETWIGELSPINN